ncbi:hypothetical protein COCCU_07035 [Corynebacterium occultum]|uniref:DUF4132 domain-containing protein n=1 Tax=Corynebacterium occultum TaxID=2675219 RepID=A0A6B8W492_9CORY|nr:DUF4132 domain-containing protein [Corynebacterium occultum]QGU07341.1 hypothetical protein COCCU_07035 [Corynebacterium occultum]
MTTAVEQTGTTWREAGDYHLRLDGNQIIARNVKGRVLKSVPAKVKKHEAFEQLEALRNFFIQHEATCRGTVENWFLTGRSVPVTVVCGVWRDDAWRRTLQDLVVTDGTVGGLLRGADESGLHLVDLEGESVIIPRTGAATITLPHPALMSDLADWREFAVELGVHQGLDQLYRHTTEKPGDPQERQRALDTYRSGHYESGGYLRNRARDFGCTYTSDGISLKVAEGGHTVTAHLDLFGHGPQTPADLGRLYFLAEGTRLDPAEIGPVAWSEGIRMAEHIWAGRTIAEDEDS